MVSSAWDGGVWMYHIACVFGNTAIPNDGNGYEQGVGNSRMIAKLLGWPW